MNAFVQQLRISLSESPHGGRVTQDGDGLLERLQIRHRQQHRRRPAVHGHRDSLVLLTDLRGVIGFSSFGVLTYYGVANASALTQERQHRRYPRALALAGLAGCVVLALAVPTGSLATGAVVLAIGVIGRFVFVRLRG